MKAFRLTALGVVGLSIFAVTGCAGDVGEGDDDGDAQEISDYTASSIVGGTTTTAHPAVAYITYLKDGAGFACTGTLIAPTLVLTAAHCVLPPPTAKKTSSWKVYFNVNDPKSIQAATPIAVSNAVAHPAYKHNSFGNGNDAAVLVLSKAAPANIKPIAVNSRSIATSAVGKSILAVGFGLSDGINKTGSGTKRQGALPIKEVRAVEIAAGKPGLSTCQGDSGGPWFGRIGNQDMIIGITSYGPAGCVDASSATRVDKVMDFIKPFLDKANGAGGKVAPAPPPAPPKENPNPAPSSDLAVGQVVNGSVSTETDTFQVNAPQQLKLRFESASAQLIITSSRGGRTVTSGRATIAMGGPADFTIEVRSPNGVAQNYTLTRDP